MCCHLGSVASFIEPRQNEFSRIPRGPVISEMENETGFNFKSTAVCFGRVCGGVLGRLPLSLLLVTGLEALL